MDKHAPDSCPRCDQIFICKVNAILKCDCLQIELTRAETEYIRDITTMEYDGGCLCVACLHELKQDYRNQLSDTNKPATDYESGVE